MYMKEVQVWVKVVPGSVRTVGAGADLWFLGRQPASDGSQVSSRPAVTLPAADRRRPWPGTSLYCLMNRGTYACVNNLPKVVI